MTDSLQKIIERIILVIVCIVGPTLFFQMYKSPQKDALAEEATRDFLENVTSSGKITETDYTIYRDSLALLDGFDTDLHYTTYHNEPVYQYYTVSQIDDFFNSRNTRDTHYVPTVAPAVVDANPDSLFMQEVSNAQIFAQLTESGLELATDALVSASATYTAVIPNQEIYVGEQLVTVVEIKDGANVYYAVGDDIAPTVSGTYRIYISGRPTNASVYAKVWNKTVCCATCHMDYTCTMEVINNYKSKGVWELCPYCEEYVKAIVPSTPSITVPLGTADTDITGLSLDVIFYNGKKQSLYLRELTNNYSPTYGGVQSISVSFNGFNADDICTITTISSQCAACGKTIVNRSGFDCQLYPNCSECMSKVPTFLGECAVVPETFFDSEITEKLLADGVFPMGRNDYLMVEVDHGGNTGVGRFSFVSSDKPIYFRMGKRVRRTGISK